MTIGRKAFSGLGAICALALAPVAAAQTATVTVNKVMADTGMIRGGLCADPDTFGKTACPEGVNATAPAKQGSVVLTFTNVKPGTYALGIFHDEDDNGELSVFTEPMAFGNGAIDLPPIFDSAALKVTGDLKTETALFKMVQ